MEAQVRPMQRFAGQIVAATCGSRPLHLLSWGHADPGAARRESLSRHATPHHEWMWKHLDATKGRRCAANNGERTASGLLRGCPIMKSLFLLCLSVPYLIVQEPSTSNLRDNGVVQRGNQVMGFSHELSAHHFRLLKDGGEIIVTANNLNDKASIDQIRSHLAHISRMFADGNFNAAVLIHDTNPPGTATMTRLKSQIRYELSEIDQGAKIRIY